MKWFAPAYKITISIGTSVKSFTCSGHFFLSLTSFAYWALHCQSFFKSGDLFFYNIIVFFKGTPFRYYFCFML